MAGADDLPFQIRTVSTPNHSEDSIGQLAEAEGLEVERDAALSGYSTFRIGGPAEFLVQVHTQTALESLLSVTERLGLPFELLGLGSNVLFPDEGLSGVVARAARR